MTITTLTSREFNQDTAGAKKAAAATESAAKPDAKAAAKKPAAKSAK